MTSGNGRPRLLASKIWIDQISMPPHGDVRLVCADCGTWQPWKRGLVKAHPPRPAELCPGSNQQVFFDLTADQLRAARAAAVAHARAVALPKRNLGEGYHPPTSRPPAGEDRDPREGYQQPPPLALAVHQIAARRITSDGETR